MFGYPTLNSLYISFTKFDITTKPVWVGFANYKFMFTQDPLFWIAVKNTLWIVIIGVPVQIVTALLITFLVSKSGRLRHVLQTVVLIPSFVPVVAGAMVFTYILNPIYGPVNAFLRLIGFSNPPMWFYDPQSSKWGLVFFGAWGVGTSIVIYSAALMRIPRQIDWLAQIDGLTEWRKAVRITFPLISPVIFYTLVVETIQQFQIFAKSYVVTAQVPDPENSMYFLATDVYNSGFKDFHFGYAAALGWALTILTGIFVALIFSTQRMWVFSNAKQD